MVKFSFLLIVIFLFVGCALIGVFPRERLRINRTDQNEAIDRLKLNVDGIFKNDYSINESFHRSFIYLFRNGVCYLGGYITINEERKKFAEETFIKRKTLPQVSPMNWGTFEIKNDSIFIEYWTILRDDIEYNRESWKGIIIDENTIRMEKGWRLGENPHFYFTPLKNKPDSTNRFIK